MGAIERNSHTKQKKFNSPFTIYNSNRFAFTLSEVLITLGTIGIVAAITIPALNNKIQDAQYKTAYKKAMSDTQNVWMKMLANNEVTNRTGRYVTSEGLADFAIFKSYFSVSKECNGNSNKCWEMSGELYNNARPVDSNYSFIDNSGRAWINIGSGYAGEMMIVDTNGFKKPNQFGKDRFPFFAVLQQCSIQNGNPVIGYNDDCLGAGIPTKLLPPKDNTTWACHNEPCYFQSWIYN